MSSKARIAIVLAVLVLVAAGYGTWRHREARRASDVLTLYGNVDIREVELSFRVPGRLLAMEVEEGDRVETGRLLAKLDAQPNRDVLAAAEARVGQAQANLEKFKHGPRPQEIQQAQAGVHEAEAAFGNAEREFKRQSELLESGAVSQTAVDTARTRRDETAARLNVARETLNLAREGYRREDIAAAQAELQAATAQRDQAETQLADTELTAPSAGTILARVREPGTLLQQGSPVYTLSLDKPVYVRAYIGEPDLGKVAPGTQVIVTTDSSDKHYRGQVGFIAPRAEFTPKSVETADLRTDLVYRLRIVVTDADAGLRQGMPVTIQISLK